MKYGLNSLAWISPFSSEHLDMLARCRDMGFDVFEIDVEDETAIDCVAISRAARSAGVEIGLCGAFGESRNMSALDAQVRGNAVGYVKRLVDFAVALGSPYVGGNMYAATGDCERRTEEEKAARMARAADSIRECAEYAKKRSVRLAIEPLNRFETDMVNTVAQAMELLDAVGMENVGLLLDTFHMNIEESDLCAAIRSARGRIVDFHACANNRGTPGQDNFDWQAIRQALSDAQYDGNLVIESFTPDCVEIARAASIWRKLAPSPDRLAQDGLAFLKNVFQA